MNAQPELPKVRMAVGILLLAGGLCGFVTGDTKMPVWGSFFGFGFRIDPSPMVSAGISCAAGIALIVWCFHIRRSIRQEVPPAAVPVFEADIQPEFPRGKMMFCALIILCGLLKMLGGKPWELAFSAQGTRIHQYVLHVPALVIGGLLFVYGVHFMSRTLVGFLASRHSMTPPPLPRPY